MLAEGQELDGFRIGPRLHDGGMAELWAATHPDHAMPLVVKVPRLRDGDDPAAIVSFEMEQMILPRLEGVHVPRFIAAGGFDRRPFLAMERIPGETLHAQLGQAPLRIERIAAIGARVADALDALHRQHVVHLDIKPANILARPLADGRGGEAVLVDFGLSHHRLLPDLLEEEFRLPYGTAPYMAPEQVAGLRAEPRSDLFALGAVLYLLTTGARPHGDPQRLAGLKRRLWRDPVPPRRLRADCPEWLQEIILRCLEVQPERRHPTAAQLAFDLRHPGQVPLTERARKARQDGVLRVMQRRFLAGQKPHFTRPAPDAEEIAAAAPILAVAVDLEAEPALHGAMRGAVAQVLATLPGARLACLNVLRHASLVGAAPAHDEAGNNRHVQRLVELQHWAAPLGLPEGRVTFHVLEASGAAAAILEYARVNRVDHVVMGARASSLRRRVLGRVSAEVASEAPCSVTVVRARLAATEA
jgi:nucleotide-binding universal stress UspA family protein